jgi:hypothetical protein
MQFRANRLCEKLLGVSVLAGSLLVPIGVLITCISLSDIRNALIAKFGLLLLALGGIFVALAMSIEKAPPLTTGSYCSSSQPRRVPFLDTLALQLVVIFLSAVILDGGVSFRASLNAFHAYWFGVLLVLFRRRSKLTRGDFWYLSWGWIIINLIYVPFSLYVWKVLGLN